MNATTYTSSTLAGIMGLESRMDKAGSVDSDLDISPVTLSSAWSRVARLLLLASMAVGGSVGNVFMISAVVVEDQLKKRGNETYPSTFRFFFGLIINFPQQIHKVISIKLLEISQSKNHFLSLWKKRNNNNNKYFRYNKTTRNLKSWF